MKAIGLTLFLVLLAPVVASAQEHEFSTLEQCQSSYPAQVCRAERRTYNCRPETTQICTCPRHYCDGPCNLWVSVTYWYGSCGTRSGDDVAPCDDYESQTSCDGEDPLSATETFMSCP
jgi:hypothetical protein